MKTPPFLKKGDPIALLSTARFVDADVVKKFQDQVAENGFEPLVDERIFARHHQMAGDASHRAKLFQEALDDPEIKAIWFARGGYGSIQLAENIDWRKFTESPKWLIGFSDTTVWHLIANRLGVKTLHAPMPSTFGETDPNALAETFALISGQPFRLSFESSPLNSLPEKLEGTLWGGNLSIIASILGSDSLPKPQNGILCLEDVGEYLYHIDRLMHQLRRADILKNAKALLVGGFSEMNDNSTPFGETAQQIIKRHCHELGLPVAFDLPFGHIPNNQPLVLGAKIALENRQHELVIREMA